MESNNNITGSSLNNNDELVINSVKIKGLGNSSLSLSRNDITIKSLESNYHITRSIDDIDFLVFSKGNFFFEDEMYIGISGKQYKIISKEEHVLKNFHDSLVRIKDNRTHVNSNIPENNADTISSADNSNRNINASDEIREFYNLMKEGIISEEEFEEKKRELLK